MGHVVSVGVMVLAVFAFGLHFSKVGDVTELHLNWEEIPAILIVFILAEFGVQLVLTTMVIKASVENSYREFETLVEQYEEIKGDVTQNLTELKKLLGILGSQGTLLSFAIENNFLRHQEQFRVNCDVPIAAFWKCLGQFAAAWIPEGTGSSQELLATGAFFRSLTDGGSIRKDQGSVTLITSDETYVNASREWLSRTIDGAKSRGRERCSLGHDGSSADGICGSRLFGRMAALRRAHFLQCGVLWKRL